MGLANDPIPFARPNLGAAEEEAVLKVLRSGWLTTGQEALAFEKEFSAAAGAGFSLAVNSATAGLHLALEAIGIGPGDYLAVSPYTFTASAEVMRYLGAHPLFVDIAPGSYHLDPQALEQTLDRGRRGLSPMPKAIMAVHIGGVAWELDRIYELAKHYQVPVIEDAAHSFPARLAPNAPERAQELRSNGPALGTEPYLGIGGDLGIFSFYANKTITTGEGGMICGFNPDWASRMKIMRLHGIDREVWSRFTSNAQQWRYAVVEAGYKYNLPDLGACIGRVQLRRADELMEARRAVVARYNEAFQLCPWITLPPKADWATTEPLGHSWHLYSLRLGEGCRVDRDAMIGELQAAAIGTSVHYIPLHIMPYYAQTYGLQPQDFPESLAAFEASLSLPLWAGLTINQVERVIETVLRIGN